MSSLLHEIRDLIQSARRAVAHSVDLIQVLTYFEIGRRIVEHEQGGEERAEYGKALLKELSAALTAEFGRGFSRSNLEYMRRFYLTYQDRAAQIEQRPHGTFLADEISQMPSGKSKTPQKSGRVGGQMKTCFTGAERAPLGQRLVGYEISFNRHFYKYVQPRPLAEIDAELKAVEQEVADLLAEVAE